LAGRLNNCNYVIRPSLQGFPLLLGVSMKVVCAIADALRLVVLNGISNLFYDPQACHARLDRRSKILRRERHNPRATLVKQTLDRLARGVFAQDAVVRDG